MSTEKRYQSWWIETNKNGSGVEIITHLNHELTMHDVFKNLDGLLCIRYINFGGFWTYSNLTTELSLDEIKIRKIDETK